MSLAKAQQYNEDLTNIEEQIREAIIKVRRARGTPEEQSKTEAVNALIDQAKKVYTRLSGLLKTEQDPKVIDQIASLKDQHKQEMTKLKSSLKMTIQKNEKEDAAKRKSSQPAEVNDSVEIVRIDGSSSSKPKKTSEEEELNDKMAEELFGPVFETQRDCLAIIDRLNIKAEETLEIGAESAEMLRAQREQLLAIDRKMDELGSNTKRAGRELTSLMRKLATDKLIVVIFILLTLVIIAAVIIRVVVYFTKEKDKNNK